MINQKSSGVNPLLFLKFGRQSHITALQKEGEIFMRLNKEFRIVVEAKSELPLQFKIGDIESYSDIFSTEHLEHFMLKL